jgi:hypothetical protein
MNTKYTLSGVLIALMIVAAAIGTTYMLQQRGVDEVVEESTEEVVESDVDAETETEEEEESEEGAAEESETATASETETDVEKNSPTEAGECIEGFDDEDTADDFWKEKVKAALAASDTKLDVTVTDLNICRDDEGILVAFSVSEEVPADKQKEYPARYQAVALFDDEGNLLKHTGLFICEYIGDIGAAVIDDPLADPLLIQCYSGDAGNTKQVEYEVPRDTFEPALVKNEFVKGEPLE